MSKMGAKTSGESNHDVFSVNKAEHKISYLLERVWLRSFRGSSTESKPSLIAGIVWCRPCISNIDTSGLTEPRSRLYIVSVLSILSIYEQ